MDVEEVYRAVREARHRAIEGEGPTLVVAETYRFQPHAEGLMQLRTEDEEDVWKEKDPIKLMKDRLTEADKLTDEEYEEIVEDVNATLEEAISFARNGTRPGPSEAYDDIYNETAPDVEYHLSNMEKL
jgi:pyruvate dehydrogenase E1 component alpha subunit